MEENQFKKKTILLSRIPLRTVPQSSNTLRRLFRKAYTAVCDESLLYVRDAPLDGLLWQILKKKEPLFSQCLWMYIGGLLRTEHPVCLQREQSENKRELQLSFLCDQGTPQESRMRLNLSVTDACATLTVELLYHSVVESIDALSFPNIHVHSCY